MKNFAKLTISGNAIGANSVFAFDVDSDGYIDVLSVSFTDNKVAWYESTTGTGVIDEDYVLPTTPYLYNNYPNPFNTSTKIEYTLPEAGTSFMKFVQLKVYDILSNQVATLVNQEKPAGKYSVNFDANNLPSGIYFYRLTAGNFSETKKMILLK